MSPKEAEALELAFDCHKDQVDKSGKPYTLHVLRVAFDNVAGCTENVLCAALLHDVVEDRGVPIQYIKAKFGVRVAAAVDHLSRRRGESYLGYIRRCGEDAIARRVKLRI